MSEWVGWELGVGAVDAEAADGDGEGGGAVVGGVCRRDGGGEEDGSWVEMFEWVGEEAGRRLLAKGGG